MTEMRAALARIRERIARAAERAKRDPEEVTLLSVSKRQPPTRLVEAYTLGVRDFGENYVQELVDKSVALEGQLAAARFHMIGHLQSNKVNQVLPRIQALHTLDSSKLAEKAARRLEGLGRQLDVYIAVNVGGEPQKHGCAPEAVRELAENVRAHAALRLVGLMTIPPNVSEPELARPYFRRLRELAEQVEVGGLSMGMSGDFDVAIEENATCVRVGTLLFGART